LDLVDLIKKLSGRPELEVLVRNIATNEVREQYASSEKARSLLKWKPRCGLEEGLRRTIRWYQEYFAAQEQIAAVQR
jgi:CDP-glucose 4,6-dehydratase